MSHYSSVKLAFPLSIFQINFSEIVDDDTNPQGTLEDEGQEFVPLPDLNEGRDDDYIYGGDPTLWNSVSPYSETDTADSNDNLLPNTDPFYANQLEDPNVQDIQCEFDLFIDGLFK